MGNNIHTKNLKMRAFAAAMLAVSVLADGHLPSDDQFGLISPKPDMGDQDKMDKLSEMISTFCEGIEYDEDKHDDHMDDHEKKYPDEKDDSDESHDDSDHEHMDHAKTKDTWLCMQAHKMLFDLKEYMHGDEHDKIRQGRAWMEEIEEMKEDWGMGGANNLAMAGAAMIVAVSALSF